MSLIRTGQGITDIRGGTGGVYFTRDKSGLHQSAKPRNIHRRSSAQNKQRNCFSKARTYSTDNRTVSYLIYLCLNDLPFLFDAIVTGTPVPDCRGTYVLVGKYDGADYYRRPDEAWLIFYKSAFNKWYIANDLEAPTGAMWLGNTTLEGVYEGLKPEYGQAVVTLQVQPPPADYQIPNL